MRRQNRDLHNARVAAANAAEYARRTTAAASRGEISEARAERARLASERAAAEVARLEGLAK